MSRLSKLLLGRPALAQTLVAACAVLVGAGVYQWDRNVSEHKRLAALQVDANRTAAQAMAVYDFAAALAVLPKEDSTPVSPNLSPDPLT